jgi:putative FmdB family regulatory protein
MPLYDLFCGKCGHQDEYLVKNPDALPGCPTCQSTLEKKAGKEGRVVEVTEDKDREVKAEVVKK